MVAQDDAALRVTEHGEVVAQDVLLLLELSYRDWRLRLDSSPRPVNIYNDEEVLKTYSAFVRTALRPLGVESKDQWNCDPKAPFTGNLLHPVQSPMSRVCTSVEKLLQGVATPQDKKLKHFVRASGPHLKSTNSSTS